MDSNIRNNIIRLRILTSTKVIARIFTLALIVFEKRRLVSLVMITFPEYGKKGVTSDEM